MGERVGGRHVVALLALLVAVSVPAGPGPTAAAAPAAAPTEAQRAAVIFLPGLVASELTCGAGPADQTNLWPGTAVGSLLTWSTDFGGLGMVNTESGGELSSRTTSSASCGSQSYGAGTAALHEPGAARPTWCIPEARFDQDGPFASCPISGASVSYNTFGYELEQAAAAAGRGQQVVFWPWDWRRSPTDQVAALQDEIVRLRDETGVRPTVVAHSFGNLLFRDWIASVEQAGHQGGEYVGRFLSVAGPWWGTAEAWTHPAFGQIQPGLDSAVVEGIIGPETIARSFSSFPGIYDIFPTQAFAEHVGEGADHWLAVPDDSSASGSRWVAQADMGTAVEEQLDSCPQSATFPCRSRLLYERAEARSPEVGFDTSGVAWSAVVGTGVRTPEQICSGCERWPEGSSDGALVTTDVTGNPILEHRIRTGSGDANVPLFSAIQGDDWTDPPGDDVPFFFTCGISHLDLMIDAQVLGETIPFLLGDAPLRYGGAFSRSPATGETCADVPATTTTTTSSTPSTSQPAAGPPPPAALPVAGDPDYTG